MQRWTCLWFGTCPNAANWNASDITPIELRLCILIYSYLLVMMLVHSIQSSKGTLHLVMVQCTRSFIAEWIQNVDREILNNERKKTIDRTRREWVECNESSPFPSVFTGNRIFRTNPKRFWSNERVWNTMIVHHSNLIQNVYAIRSRWVTDQCKCEIPKINQKSTESNTILNDKILNWHSKCQRVLFRVNILYKICISKCISIQQPFTYVLKWNAVNKINLLQSQLLGWINNSPQSNSHEWHLSIRVWAQYFGHRWMQHQFFVITLRKLDDSLKTTAVANYWTHNLTGAWKQQTICINFTQFRYKKKLFLGLWN